LDANAIVTDGGIQNHSFHIASDEDWLSFSATSGIMYAIETFNLTETDTYVYLFDSDGTTILDTDDNSGVGLGSYISWTAPSDDTYYVRIMASYGFAGPNCTYEINITETQPATGDIYEPDDIPGEATQIQTDGTMQSHDFHVYEDMDWINFTAVEGTTYIIETHNLGIADTYIYLFDSDGFTVLESDDDGSSEPLASKIVWTSPRDDNFYVMIKEYDGDFGPSFTYDVNISTYGYPGGDAFEPDDSYIDSNAILQDGTMQSHNFHYAGDVDWIRIITMTGWTYTIETHNLGDADTEIFLYADDGTTQLGFDDDGGVDPASKIVWTAPGNNIIYVRVEEVSNFYGPTYTYDINVIETQYLPEPPGAPENFTAQAGDSYVNLSWDPPASNGSSAISNYTIYRNTTSGFKEIYLEIGNQTYYNDTNVTNFVTYYYNISAKSIDGEGNISNETYVTPYLLPTASILVKADPGNSYINLTWDAPASDGGSPIINYTIYRKSLFGSKTNIATVGKLVSVPTSPANLEITYGDTFVRLTWEAPASTGGSPITNYIIYKGTDSGDLSFLVELGNVTIYNDTSVTNGIMYYYQVSAKSSVGEGALSWEGNGKPATVPGTPTNVTAKGVSFLGVSAISITWSPPAFDGGSQITNYQIYRGTKPDELTFLADAGSLPSYIDSDIKSGVKYYYKVVAENEMGEGISSAEASVTPKEISAAPLFLFLGIILIIIIVVVVLVVLLILKRKKGKKEEVEPQIRFEKASRETHSTQTQGETPMIPPEGYLPPGGEPGQYPSPPPSVQPPGPPIITYKCPHCQELFTAESPNRAFVVACPSCEGHTTIEPA
jgi:fibronectin type 3 domain-containing protein